MLRKFWYIIETDFRWKGFQKFSCDFPIFQCSIKKHTAVVQKSFFFSLCKIHSHIRYILSYKIYIKWTECGRICAMHTYECIKTWMERNGTEPNTACVQRFYSIFTRCLWTLLGSFMYTFVCVPSVCMYCLGTYVFPQFYGIFQIIIIFGIWLLLRLTCRILLLVWTQRKKKFRISAQTFSHIVPTCMEKRAKVAVFCLNIIRFDMSSCIHSILLNINVYSLILWR